MKRFFCVSFLLIVFSHTIWAQISVTKNLKGKIVSNAIDLEGIYIVNLKTDESTTTINGGYFDIQAKVGDTLMFSAIQFKGKKVVVTEKDFNDKLFFVKLETMINQLEEVKIIRYNNINAVALGILQKPAKVYTPAERRLKTATGLDARANVGSMAGGSISLDPLMNWVSGRTAMLKKEVVVERKELLLKKIEDIFETSFFTEKLKIPTDYVKAFHYYIVEDEKFVNAMNSKNITMATFVLGDLAVEYLKLLASEK